MSEFGKGYAYCLGLFLAHAERHIGDRDKIRGGLWLYGAADHIFELEIPDQLTDDEKMRADAFKGLVLDQRMGEVPWKEVDALIQTAKDLLLEWDKRCGISAEKGDYE